MRVLSCRLACFAAVSLAAGCGRVDAGAPMSDGGTAVQSGDDAACQSAPACGGDLVGTWNITTSCLDVDLSTFTADCPSATAHAVDYAVTGTVTYNADLTYTLTSTLSGRVVATWPAPCLTPADGVQVTCAQLGAALAAPGTYRAVTCVAAVDPGTGCTCSVEMNPQSSWSAGRYMTDASGGLTETDSGGSARQRDYCVKGDGTMTLSPFPSGVAQSQFAMASGPITLARQ